MPKAPAPKPTAKKPAPRKAFDIDETAPRRRRTARANIEEVENAGPIRVDAEEVEDTRPTSKKSTKVRASTSTDVVQASPRDAELVSILREMEKVVRVNAVSFGEEVRLHSGLLCLDALIGGGIAPGWYTFAGPEQSAKTTAAITISGASVEQQVNLRCLWDAENSSGSSTDYVARIFSNVGARATVDSVFGVRDEKGNYIVPPKIYYRDDPEGAKFFSWLRGVLTRLPDKRYEAGRWWLVYDDGKDVMKTKARLKELGYKIDPHMTARNPGLWVPAEDGTLQALVIIDSLPSLLPPSQEDDEADNSLAVMARFFSKEIPRVKGLFRAKRCALIAINQLRINPMQRFGNPETEPGGNAPRFFSDVRLRFFPNALSSAPFAPKGDGKFETEPSVDGEGVDTYRYISVSTIKNKLSTPGRTNTWLRLWVSDKNGQGMGYDPVFDAFYLLYMTGQVIGKRSDMCLNINGMGQAQKNLNWMDFKKLILGTRQQKIEIFERIGYRPVDIRKGLLNQIRKGVTQQLMLEQVKAAAAKSLPAPKGSRAADGDDDTDDDGDDE